MSTIRIIALILGAAVLLLTLMGWPCIIDHLWQNTKWYVVDGKGTTLRLLQQCEKCGILRMAPLPANQEEPK